jgi:hypothetical protein
VRDEIDRVVAGHVLLLQEVGGVAFALGKDGHQHVGAGYFLAARRLDVDHRALNDALEAGCGLGILVITCDQVAEFLVDIVAYRAAQLVDIDIARAHDRRSIGILDQRQQQMLKRGILVMPLIGIGQRLMDRLFETV